MELWQHFVRLPGAKIDGVVGIASECAIDGLIRIIRRYRPARILELGAGIGTLTKTVLETAVSERISQQDGLLFYTIENHPFCVAQLSVNLTEYEGMYRLVSDVSELPEVLRFDLIVVDAGGDLPNDLGVIDFSDRLARGGVILVEGGRAFQRNLIAGWYGHRHHVALRIRPPISSVGAGGANETVRLKGYHLFVFEPRLPEFLRLMLLRLWHRVVPRLLRAARRRLQD